MFIGSFASVYASVETDGLPSSGSPPRSPKIHSDFCTGSPSN